MTSSTSEYDRVTAQLRKNPQRWLVTGAAGFIGSNLAESLLKLDQTVVGLDNFATGHRHNLDDLLSAVSPEQRARFSFIEGDITDPECCEQAVRGIDLVLHQAALGSVPRSVAEPLLSNKVNVEGFLLLLVAAEKAGIKRFVYASSSSVYGDNEELPKHESQHGKMLSPYAATKRANELYAEAFAATTAVQPIGLRYFNVFGPRQDPAGVYAAVIPKWVDDMVNGRRCVINGDGETSRDFCFIANVVQANILAACAPASAANQVFNIAVGERTTLNELHAALANGLKAARKAVGAAEKEILAPEYKPFRVGDVRHSLADISAAERVLGYRPSYRAAEGFNETVSWFYRTSGHR